MRGKKKDAETYKDTDSIEEIQYYSLDQILKKKAQYNVIFGERSNGKSYSVLLHALKIYVKTGKQLAIVRRFDNDIKMGKADSFYDAIVANGEIEKITHGKYTHVRYWQRRFYLAYHDENLDKDVRDNRPFAYTFAVNTASQYKSTSYPDITTICFDEFLERQYYLPDEFPQFMNIVSTIVRQRNDVTIFMLGNTVNKHCPYFTEMGLSNIQNMRQGAIEVYKYGNTNLRVAVEYCSNLNKNKPSDVYFAFNNPKLQMITGGVWEMAMYPHCPTKYLPKQVVLDFFIDYDGNLLHAECVDTGADSFIFIHRKTTPIQDNDTDIIYSLDYSPKPNHVRRINRPVNKWQRMIFQYFVEDRVFYQDNEVGEIVRNYLMASSSDKIR